MWRQTGVNWRWKSTQTCDFWRWQIVESDLHVYHLGMWPVNSRSQLKKRAPAHPPLSVFVDVFSSSMSWACFSISLVYCSTCSLSILIWWSLSWTAFRESTNNLYVGVTQTAGVTQTHTQSSAGWSISLMSLGTNGKVGVRDTWRGTYTAKFIYNLAQSSERDAIGERGREKTQSIKWKDWQTDGRKEGWWIMKWH